ncbi:VOC family protein [Dactylosporangium sp. CA-092794]|uniref:VOC family protein n=1 Tax=Dactylosporangium sp. CA-092794 TaxID=3239929 RepID=UPI003D933FE5
MTVTGPDFIGLQVRDLEQAANFYESRLGLKRAPVAPPHAVVFATEPIAFAVREPQPGVDLDAVTPHPGAGIVLWLQADDAQALHDRLAADGVPITVPPFDGPFGRTFTFTDPDGYAVTIHDR